MGRSGCPSTGGSGASHGPVYAVARGLCPWVIYTYIIKSQLWRAAEVRQLTQVVHGLRHPLEVLVVVRNESPAPHTALAVGSGPAHNWC